MKEVAALYGINEKNFKLRVYEEDNKEFVIIGNTRIPIKYLNMKEFERYEIIEKSSF